MNFFKAIGEENVLSAQFDVLGDGKDEALIKQFIDETIMSSIFICEDFVLWKL